MPETRVRVAIIGGGPAGLMAADVLSAHDIAVQVFDAMPSVGRKFLLAGIGGMNITHSEPFEDFVARYRERESVLRPFLEAFSPDALRAWIHALGIETFVGSSGRVFPTAMKAAPLLRAWLHRLRERGVVMHTRHRWRGWHDDALRFDTRDGEKRVHADAVVLALGGASWPKLGSDAAWVPWLETRGVNVRAFRPSNCGFEVAWSEHLRVRFAGAAVKPVVLRAVFSDGERFERRGEFVVTAHGIEGSLVYAASALLREEIERAGEATTALDLAPDRDESALRDALMKPRGRKSLSEHLRRRAGIEGVKAALLRERVTDEELADPAALAARIKSLPLRLVATRPIDEAISSAGGVMFDALNDDLMLRALPGVFAAGEMLDWEAPTGGYLLTACLATGKAAGEGVLRWLHTHS